MLNAAKAYRRLKEIEEKKLENRLNLLAVRFGYFLTHIF
jgi:hypothetical protein